MELMSAVRVWRWTACHSLLLWAVFSVTLPVSMTAVQCRGQKGEPVDWFIMYKLPKMRHQKGTPFGEGHAQFYMDDKNHKWTLSPIPINLTGHAIYFTLQQIYAAEENSLLYLMFNDEKPSGSTSISHGHTKGTLGFDGQSGFWLIHSAPRFPPEKKDGYSWAENASDFGQTFLCMSFSYKSLTILTKQWLFYYPQVYDYFLPPAALSDFPLLADLVNSTRITHPPYFSVCSNLSSLAGMPLINFAKFTYFGADLYDALVAPTLKVSLVVQSWQHAKESVVLPSNCSTPYQVFNGVEVILPGNRLFTESKDHSKYALSISREAWVCVGGINRETTQFKRAGGTLCFHNEDVWASFKDMVTFFEPCSLTHT